MSILQGLIEDFTEMSKKEGDAGFVGGLHERPTRHWKGLVWW